MTGLELTFTGAEVLCPGEGLCARTLSIGEGRILADPAGRVVDLSGYLILPGIVDLHGDAFERHLAPRRGAMPDMAEGVIATEAELAANGITTGVLAQFYSWEGGVRGPAYAAQVFAAIREAQPLVVTDLRAQLRFETHMLDDYEELPQKIADWGVSYLVFNDHLPHDRLAAGKVPARLTGQALKAGRNPEVHLAMLQDMHARSAEVPAAIDRLIGRAQDVLTEMGITAPLMVVRGDGALMSAEQARIRPIETILSGPAASIVGARWLTGIDEGLVSDIGGTTTDVAMLKGGRPAIDPEGAEVGGHRTMVEAVAMRTTGLGGDSQVHVVTEGLDGGVSLGPRRVLPVSLVATEAPEVVHRALDEQLRAQTVGEYDGRFLRAVPGMAAQGLSARESELLARLGSDLHPMGHVLRTRMEQGALGRLVDRGLVQVAGVTPSDASHVLGRLDSWDAEAAEKAVTLMARRRTGSGGRLAPDAETLAGMIIDQLTEQTVIALLETAFAEEAESFNLPARDLARHMLVQRSLGQHRGILALDARLNVDVVGLGASAPAYYPAVGERLRCRMILPDHAGVANAIGAVVGRVTVRRSGTVTSPAEGRYRVHLETGPEDFGSSDAALSRLEGALRADAETAAAGAEGLQIRVDRDIRTARTEAREVFVEAVVTVEASGRPRVAVG